ncbi:MAG: DNA cytosine methyltransferase [Syntrophobacteraceae bacterium]|nr:DNA cytosine methyltransferase [Syntrophobacteraceae bacterium]
MDRDYAKIEHISTMGCLPHSSQEFSVVSMFSGCGGMDLGFIGGFEVFGRYYGKLPFRIIWANEHNPKACATYRRNIGEDILCRDVWDALDTLPGTADVLIGGFPCQDISLNGKRAGVNGKRSGLYRAMVQAIERTKPSVFVAENVGSLLMSCNAASLQQVMADFGELGYRLSCEPYQAADYSVPQTRHRVFIVGTSYKVKPFVPPPTERATEDWMTVKEAIEDLESMDENPGFNHIWSRANKSPEQGDRILRADRPGYTIRAECHGNIQWHYRLKRRMSMREAARVQSFPDSFIFDSMLRETERQVGNAVPPVLAWHVALQISKFLHNRADDCAITPNQATA